MLCTGAKSQKNCKLKHAQQTEAVDQIFSKSGSEIPDNIYLAPDGCSLVSSEEGIFLTNRNKGKELNSNIIFLGEVVYIGSKLDRLGDKLSLLFSKNC